MGAMLDSFREDTLAAVSGSIEDLRKQLVSRMEKLFRDYDVQIQHRLNIIDTDLEDVKAKYNTLLQKSEAESKKLWAAIEKLQNSLVVAQNDDAPVRPDVDPLQFDRPVLHNKLVLSCDSLIDLAACSDAIHEWLFDWLEADKDDFVLVPGDVTDMRATVGKKLSRKWSLFFCGPAAVASRRASKALSALRWKSGEWERLWVELPAGGHLQLFVSPDKNQKALATAAQGKRLFNAVKEYMSASDDPAIRKLPVHLLKWQGIVTVNWQNLAKIQMESSSEKTFLWNNRNLAKLFASSPPEVAKTTITQSFEDKASFNPRLPSESEWSR